MISQHMHTGERRCVVEKSRLCGESFSPYIRVNFNVCEKRINLTDVKNLYANLAFFSGVKVNKTIDLQSKYVTIKRYNLTKI